MSRRTGQIIKRGDRKWLIRSYRGEERGRKLYESRTINGTKRDAQRALAKLSTEIQSGRLPQRSNYRLGEWCEWWLDNVKSQRVRTVTLADYRSNLERYVKTDTIWRMRLQHVKTEHLQAFIRRLQQDPDRKLGPRSIKMIHSILSGALGSARRLDKIAVNPARDVELPTQKGREMRALSGEEVRRLLVALQGDRFEHYFALAVDTGARPSELLALQWGDLDQDAATISIVRTLPRLKKGEPVRFEDPKNKSSRRTLDINASTVQALAAHRRRMASDRLVAGRGPIRPGDLVFTSEPRPKPRSGGVSVIGGGPVDQRNLTNRHFKPAVERAELGSLRLYDLRHTMATTLLMAGVPVNAVSARLGHASAAMTLDVYAHVMPEAHQMVASAIHEAFFSSEA